MTQVSQGDFEWLNLADNPRLDLLEIAYTKLYLTAFQDPEEQESLEQYRERILDRNPQRPFYTNFLVLGQNLQSQSHANVQGMMIVEYYTNSRCGLLTYIVVSADLRGQGIARNLLELARRILHQTAATLQTLPPQGLLAEMHDPALVKDDVIDPQIRVNIMKKLGAHRVPCHYVQPELQPGTGRSRKLWLLSFPISTELTGKLSATALQTFMYDFYVVLGVPYPQHDADYLTMVSEIPSFNAQNEILPGYVLPADINQQTALPIISWLP